MFPKSNNRIRKQRDKLRDMATRFEKQQSKQQTTKASKMRMSVSDENPCWQDIYDRTSLTICPPSIARTHAILLDTFTTEVLNTAGSDKMILR